MTTQERPTCPFDLRPAEPAGAGAPAAADSGRAGARPGSAPDALALPGELALLAARAAAARLAPPAAGGGRLRGRGPDRRPARGGARGARARARRPANTSSRWCGTQDDGRAGRARAGAGQRLVPDVLALPVPAEGSCSVREVDGPRAGAPRRRHRLRDPRRDASRPSGAPPARRRSCSSAGGCRRRCRSARPACMPPARRRSRRRLRPAAGPATPGSDAGRRRRWPRLGAVAALALAAHGADPRRRDLRAAAASPPSARPRCAPSSSARLPGLPASVPLDVALRRAMPAQAGPTRGGFLPLLAAGVAGAGAAGGRGDAAQPRLRAADGGLSLLGRGARPRRRCSASRRPGAARADGHRRRRRPPATARPRRSSSSGRRG